MSSVKKQSVFVFVLACLCFALAVPVLKSQLPRWDWTDDQRFSLDQATLGELNSLTDRLTIRFYVSQNLPVALHSLREQLLAFFKNIQDQSSADIVFEIHHPDINDQKTEDALNLGLKQVELNVIEDDRRELARVFLGVAFYHRDKKHVIPALLNLHDLEYAFSVGLRRLLLDKKPRVGVVVGSDASQYKLIDEMAKELGTLVPVPNADTDLENLELDLLVLIQPNPESKRVTAQWDRLLKNGVSILLAVSSREVNQSLQVKPATTEQTRAWLGQYGLELSEGFAVDIKQNVEAGFDTGLMQVFLAYPFWIKALAADLNKNQVAISSLEDLLIPWSNSLGYAPDPLQSSNARFTPWITRSQTTFVQRDEDQSVSPQYLKELDQMPKLEKVTLAGALEPQFEGSAQPGKVVVLATPYLLRDDFLEQSHSNIIFGSNVIEWLTLGEGLIGLRSKVKTARPLRDIAADEKQQVRVLVVLVLIGMSLGLWVLALLWRRATRY